MHYNIVKSFYFVLQCLRTPASPKGRGGGGTLVGRNTWLKKLYYIQRRQNNRALIVNIFGTYLNKISGVSGTNVFFSNLNTVQSVYHAHKRSCIKKKTTRRKGRKKYNLRRTFYVFTNCSENRCAQYV
jgi:hypothetical protein